eukprot:5146782-Amphidinium_carterae.1
MNGPQPCMEGCLVVLRRAVVSRTRSTNNRVALQPPGQECEAAEPSGEVTERNTTYPPECPCEVALPPDEHGKLYLEMSTAFRTTLGSVDPGASPQVGAKMDELSRDWDFMLHRLAETSVDRDRTHIVTFMED